MRPVTLLLAVACCVPTLPAASAHAIETRQILTVSLEQLLNTPQSFRSVPLRFTATWIGITNVFDTQRSHFHPDRYINFAVWDERAPLWQPAARAKPLVSLYMGKDLPGADRPAQIDRFQSVEIEGRIIAIMDDQPWIEVTVIRPLPGHGAFTEASIAQLEQAVRFADEGAADLADEHFAAALATNLPPVAQVQIGELRARTQLTAGRFEAAAGILRALLPVAEAEGGFSGTFRAGLHAALARSISETAGEDAKLHAEAVTQAQRAVDLDPTLSEAYAVLGVSLAGLGRFDEARLQSDRAVRMRPDDAAVRLALGRILDRQGKHDEAIDALKRAIDLTPKDARVHRAIAAAYLNRGRAGNAADLPIALRECDITLRLSAQDAEAHWLAGQVLEAATAAKVEMTLPSGKAVPTRDQAKERYQTALGIDPNLASAKASLQIILDAEAAEKAAEEARIRAEQEAKAKAEAEAKAKAEAEAKAKADAEAAAEAAVAAEAKAKADAEAAAVAAEAKAKADAEAAAEAAAKAAEGQTPAEAPAPPAPPAP